MVIPTKSQSDDRDYKVITLENKLTAILVSDPTTDKVNSAQKGQNSEHCVILRGRSRALAAAMPEYAPEYATCSIQ